MISPQFPEEVPTRVPERTLREFAGLCLAILGGLFALSWYRHQQAPNLAAWVAAALGLLIGVPGLIRPNLIRPVYLGAMALTKPIGHVVGLVLLAVVYYGVMTPLALAFRMTGRDGLGRYRWEPIRTGSITCRPRTCGSICDSISIRLGSMGRPAVPAPVSAPMPPVGPAIIAERTNPQSPVLPGVKHGST